MTRTLKVKDLNHTRLACNYGGWIYCEGCGENIGYLCYVTYDSFQDMLSKLQNLERLGLRFVPDLTNMPRLAQWKNLISFIGYNIEETEGKRLRTELNNLRKEKDLEYSSVTKLRKATWFTTEYEIPFSGWNKKNEKIATKAYKACLKLINKSNTEEEVHQAILQFIEVINQLEGIETSEREDVGTAVSQLIETSEFGISQKTGEQWFDEMRDF